PPALPGTPLVGQRGQGRSRPVSGGRRIWRPEKSLAARRTGATQTPHQRLRFAPEATAEKTGHRAAGTGGPVRHRRKETAPHPQVHGRGRLLCGQALPRRPGRRPDGGTGRASAVGETLARTAAAVPSASPAGDPRRPAASAGTLRL